MFDGASVLPPAGGLALVAVAVAVAVAVVVVLVWRRGGVGSGGVAGADFEVRYRPGPGPRGGTTVRGQVPASKLGALRAFFERDLKPDGPLTVRGTWGPAPARVLRLRIQGAADDGQRQRIRNFLITLLR